LKSGIRSGYCIQNANRVKAAVAPGVVVRGRRANWLRQIYRNKICQRIQVIVVVDLAMTIGAKAPMTKIKEIYPCEFE
jgi:hypothetical protein